LLTLSTISNPTDAAGIPHSGTPAPAIIAMISRELIAAFYRRLNWARL